MLCPAISETGNPVQVYPVAGYPLGVTVSWGPTQAGSGDPSPDNVRPIIGRGSVSVTRCGRNIIDYSVFKDSILNGVTYTKQPDGGIKLAGTASKESFCSPQYYTNTPLPVGKYTAELFGQKNASLQIVIKRANGNNEWVTRTFEIGDGDSLLYTYIRVASGTTCDETVYPMIVAGNEKPTAYEPYTGDTIDIALPETVYGGTLDWNTGVLIVTHGIKALDYSATLYDLIEYDNSIRITVSCDVNFAKENSEAICTHLTRNYNTNDYPHFYMTKFGAIIFLPKTALISYDEDGVRAYIKQQSESGSPMQFCYALQTPYSIQLTPQKIAAISGVNTIYTDAEGLTVTAREDMQHRLETITNAIVSLGGNV